MPNLKEFLKKSLSKLSERPNKKETGVPPAVTCHPCFQKLSAIIIFFVCRRERGFLHLLYLSRFVQITVGETILLELVCTRLLGKKVHIAVERADLRVL